MGVVAFSVLLGSSVVKLVVPCLNSSLNILISRTGLLVMASVVVSVAQEFRHVVYTSSAPMISCLTPMWFRLPKAPTRS